VAPIYGLQCSHSVLFNQPIFMPPVTLRWGITVLSCSSVHPSVCAPQTTVKMVSCTVFDTFSPNLHQQCIMGQRWTHHNSGSKGQRSRWNKVWWKQHFLGSLTRCLEKFKYKSDFHQTYINDVLWDWDECTKFWSQKVTIQGHGGITYAGTTTVQAEAYSSRHLASS